MDSLDTSKLHAQSQRDRIQFLQTDLELCFTFANQAVIELQPPSDTEAAAAVLAKAELAYSTLTRFLPGVEDEEERRPIGEKLLQLRCKLDSLQRQIHPVP